MFSAVVARVEQEILVWRFIAYMLHRNSIGNKSFYVVRMVAVG